MAYKLWPINHGLYIYAAVTIQITIIDRGSDKLSS